MRAALVILFFLPFVYFGIKDAIFHFGGRRVTVTEHLLHLAIGILCGSIFTQAMLGHYPALLASLAAFVFAGSIDEYIFHRNLPGQESDYHAKEHLALLIFLVAVAGFDWLKSHDWRLDSLMPRAAAVAEVQLAIVDRGYIPAL